MGGMRALSLACLLAAALLMAGCMPPEAVSDAGAEQALRDFFAHLHAGEYAQAEALYGGSYDTLIQWNPDVDAGEHVALWERGCTQNGLQCLDVERAMLNEARGGAYFFKVRFFAPDGSVFERPACCGATTTEMPATSVFDYTVLYSNGRYQVITLPVYIP